MSEPTTVEEQRQPLLSVRDLRVTFRGRRQLLSRKPAPEVHAVDGVSFDVYPGETVSLVGESGCGKSTTARGLMRLVEPDAGTVHLDGQELVGLPPKQLRTARQKIQMVFQDPYSSLDPSMLVGASIAEPLDSHTNLTRAEKLERVAESLRQVGMDPDYGNRYPHEFSGGQRQRITIARAISIKPKLLILDEAVSALDVSTQNQVLELLEQLQEELGLAYLFIAHDLSVVRHISDRVAVMYMGRVVEHGDVDQVFENPTHPYTQALRSAVPVPSPRIQRQRKRMVLQGDPPDPSNLPTGCRFSSRCPYVMDICHEVDPPAYPLPGGGASACHLLADRADTGLVQTPS